MHHQKFKARQQVIQDITEYIEIFYNRQRKQNRLGYMSAADLHRPDMPQPTKTTDKMHNGFLQKFYFYIFLAIVYLLSLA